MTTNMLLDVLENDINAAVVSMSFLANNEVGSICVEHCMLDFTVLFDGRSWTVNFDTEVKMLPSLGSRLAAKHLAENLASEEVHILESVTFSKNTDFE